MKIPLLLLLLSTAHAETKDTKRLNENNRRTTDVARKEWFTASNQSSNSNANQSSNQSNSNGNQSSSNQSSSQSNSNQSSQFTGLQSLPISSRMGCPSGQRKLKFHIQVDRWGSETTWELRQLSTDEVVMSNSRTYGQFDEETVEQCVDSGYPEEQYELILWDEVVSCTSYSKINCESQIPKLSNAI